MPTSTITRTFFESYNLLKVFSQGDMLPDLTGFNTALSNERKCSQITYLGIIDGSPTQYSTIYAMLQIRLRFFENLATNTILLYVMKQFIQKCSKFVGNIKQ